MLSPTGLRQRSELLQTIRLFFLGRDYIEVETPLRLPVLIPESNLIAFASEDCFLQTSPELCMKRLLARGCDRIFQICHCFRKEEHGRLHQSEFTMLEWYHKRWSYRELMDQCEELVWSLVNRFPDLPGVLPGGQLRRQGEQISMSPPWDRLTVDDAFRRYAGMTAREALRTGAFDEILVEAVEPYLGRQQPVFLCDYPVELGSLARRSPRDSSVAERFELYVGGVELANGFSELTDPSEQRQRFAMEIEALHAAGRAAGQPEKLLADLPLIGETAGVALGLDRLCMFLMGSPDISGTMSVIFEEL